jgi:hypothetical protein
MNLRKFSFALVVALLLGLVAVAAFAQTTACSATNYTTACIGQTICWTATGTSAITIPQNLNRRYLLIQSQSTANPLYFAIGPTSTSAPLVATIGVNTFTLVPQGNNQLPNYEVSSLNATATPPPRVPNGAVAVITDGTSIQACITENNG